MGTGIVLTANNFGMAGARPSNPDLLDFLTVKFKADGMSFKKLQKFIMMSRAYQLATDEVDANRAKDPDNRLYWRANTKRLDAEGVWDYLFTAGGNLDLEKIGGPSKDLQDGMNRRGLYGTSSRMFPNTFQLTFDFQTPTNSVERRFTTIIPQQRLFFLNSPIVHKEAALLAERASKESTPEAQVKKVFQIVLQRDPSPTELSTSLEFMSSLPPPEKTTQDSGAEKAQPADKGPTDKPEVAENIAAAGKAVAAGKAGSGNGSPDSAEKKEKDSPQKDTPLKHLSWAVLSSNELIYIN